MKRFFLYTFAFFGGFIFLFVVASFYFLLRSEAPLKLPENTILEFTVPSGLSDSDESKGLIQNLFKGKTLSLESIRHSIYAAAEDKRVKGLSLRLDRAAVSLAQAQEIVEMLVYFKSKGKRIIAFADTFGDGLPGMTAYYLASAADEIWVQPMGSLGLSGLMIEVPFAAEVLKKLKITPDFAHREEYKTLFESFVHNDFTPPSKEQLKTLLNDWIDQVALQISKYRRIPVGSVKTLIGQGPFLAIPARESKLIDEVGYYDKLQQKLLGELNLKRPKFIDLEVYSERVSNTNHPNKIAIVYGEGTIIRHDANMSPFKSQKIMAADQVAEAIYEASKNKEVKAIVLRIESGGGSVEGSETIYRAVRQARENTGKPVIVSMGTMAASGGYWIASAANKVVASPGTITGSIGVISGKLLTSEFWQSWGVSWKDVKTHDNAGLFSQTINSPLFKKKLNESLDYIYQGFLERVASGRNLSIEKVRSVAKGRVWSGQKAFMHGLVDELGGIESAIRLAVREAKIDPNVPVSEVVYPRADMRSLFVRILQGGVETCEHFSILTSFLKSIGLTKETITRIQEAQAPLSLKETLHIH